MQFICFVIDNIHKFAVKRVETDKPRKSVHEQKFKSGYIIVFANSEDDLQHSIYQFQLTAEKFSMKISIDKSKAMAFKGKEHIRSKICVYDKPIEQVSSFKHLHYKISYEKDINISTKIVNYDRAMGIINQIFKPSLVQKRTRISL
jgi:hypothetical protein